MQLLRLLLAVVRFRRIFSPYFGGGIGDTVRDSDPPFSGGPRSGEKYKNCHGRAALWDRG